MHRLSVIFHEPRKGTGSAAAGRPRAAARVGLVFAWAAQVQQQIALGAAAGLHESGHRTVLLDTGRVRAATGEVKELAGVVTYVGDDVEARQVTALGVPVVNCSLHAAGVALARVVPDYRAMGQLAAEHLLQLGLRRFTFVGHDTASHRLRGAGFAERLAEAGFACDRRVVPRIRFGLGDHAPDEVVPVLEAPFGLMCGGDGLAVGVTEACRALGLAVPHDVAVVSANNDVFLSGLADPPVSSVEARFHEVGRQAALALVAWLQSGRAPGAPPILVPPGPVVPRQSTQTLAVQDEAVARALTLMRARVDRGINVGEVAEAAGLSRTTLEVRMRRAVGRSPGQYLAQLRLERAQHLLARTELPIKRVAVMAGYRSPEQMAVSFRRLARLSPSAYRARTRLVFATP